MSENLANRFPPNDALLVDVMAVIQQRADPIASPDLVRLVAERTGFERMLHSEEHLEIVRGGVAYCVEILVREGLVERQADRSLCATAAGLEADREQLNQVWANELAHSDEQIMSDRTKAIFRLIGGFFDI